MLKFIFNINLRNDININFIFTYIGCLATDDISGKEMILYEKKVENIR